MGYTSNLTGSCQRSVHEAPLILYLMADSTLMETPSPQALTPPTYHSLEVHYLEALILHLQSLGDN